MNLDKFLAELRPDQPELSVVGRCTLVESFSEQVSGLEEFYRRMGGRSYGGGIYRVHHLSEVQEMTELCLKFWPSLEGRVITFASDWTGRQFGLDLDGRASIRLFLPSEGDHILFAPDLESLHNEVLISRREESLERTGYEEWLNNGGVIPKRDECVGFKVPLFSEGLEILENRELLILSVYWDKFANLYCEEM